MGRKRVRLIIHEKKHTSKNDDDDDGSDEGSICGVALFALLPIHLSLAYFKGHLLDLNS